MVSVILAALATKSLPSASASASIEFRGSAHHHAAAEHRRERPYPIRPHFF